MNTKTSYRHYHLLVFSIVAGILISSLTIKLAYEYRFMVLFYPWALGVLDIASGISLYYALRNVMIKKNIIKSVLLFMTLLSVTLIITISISEMLSNLFMLSVALIIALWRYYKKYY